MSRCAGCRHSGDLVSIKAVAASGRCGVAEDDGDAGGVEHAHRRPVRCGQAADGDQLVVQVEQFGVVQRPLWMPVRHVPGAAVRAGVQAPARGEEVFQRRRLGNGCPDAYRHPAGRAGRTGPAAAAPVGERVAGAVQPHRRPLVRQAQAQLRHQHGHQPGRVERAEHDSAPPRAVDRVEPDVRLPEGAEVGHARTPPEPQPDHPEADQPDVGEPVERVRPGACGQQRRHPFRRDRPVQERQVVPALRQPGPADGAYRSVLDRLDLHRSILPRRHNGLTPGGGRPPRRCCRPGRGRTRRSSRRGIPATPSARAGPPRPLPPPRRGTPAPSRGRPR